MGNRHFQLLVALLASAPFACAHGAKTYSKRIIDTPTGTRIVPGARQSTSYAAQVAMEHNIAHIQVLESSVCPVIELRTIERMEETLDGTNVVERVAKGPHEVAATQPTFMQCEARRAQGLPVSLQYGADTYPLGATDDHGALRVDLASAMRVNTRAIDLSAQTASLLVGGARVVDISLAGLLKQQERADGMIEHLTALLSKGDAKTNAGDMTNASMLMEELRELAPDDARVIALQRRYLEVVAGFKDIQRTESMRRNLGALAEAKEVLAVLSARSAVPQYVQLAIASDSPSIDALSWARAQAIFALRRHRGLCGDEFDWTQAGQLDERARVALSYLRFASDPGDLRWLCTI